jgi:hypothetical protein
MEYQILTKDQQAEILRDRLQQAEREHFISTLDGTPVIAAALEEKAAAITAVLQELGVPAVLPPEPPETAQEA